MGEEIHGTLYFKLQLHGREGGGLFTELSGGASENAVIEQKVAMPDGHIGIRKIPGNLKFGDITLKRGLDDGLDLWKWRQLVIDGKYKEARCDGTLMMLDHEMKPIATYAFTAGWPSKYTPAGMNAGQDQAALEEITIAVEEYKRVP
ncbi:MAG: phage tail protein [Solirubrobacteraceae bacterium]|nr:phage tail protein [Solirubrobacteraceae bacterium]